jgi:hypothetical protein
MKTTMPRLALLCLTLAAPALPRAGDGHADGGARPFRPPPQEAVEACAKLPLDATCRFTFDGRAHEGVCRRGPEGQGPVACAPHRGPEGRQGGGPDGRPGEGSGPERGSASGQKGP